MPPLPFRTEPCRWAAASADAELENGIAPRHSVAARKLCDTRRSGDFSVEGETRGRIDNRVVDGQPEAPCRGYDRPQAQRTALCLASEYHEGEEEAAR